MLGRIVVHKGICIVEHEGERFYLDRKAAQGFQLGDTIEFEEILPAPTGQMRSIRTQSEPPEKTLDLSFPEKHPRDLTGLQTFSIDPEGSRDLDDALSIDSDRIYVHIPYFHLTEELEKHARERQFSIYYLDKRVDHLLPLKYSIQKYSLLQDQLRLTWTVEFDHQMNFLKIYKAYIINKHQWTYSQAEKLKETELQKIFEIFRSCCRRRNRIPAYQYTCDNGSIVRISEEEHLESHDLIEFYMVNTNSAVAEYLSNQKILFPRRAHDPSMKPQDFSGLSQEITDTLRVISSPAAYYTVLEKNHSDLNLSNYTHFTSPIRRYIDQVISRLLDGEKFTPEALQEICTQANVQERRIEFMHEELFSKQIQSYLRNHPEHQGIITKVSAWGIHAIIPEVKARAELHVSKLKAGRLVFEKNMLRGKKNFKIGDLIQLKYENNEWICL